MAGEDEDKIDMVSFNLRDLDSTFQKGLEDADVQSQANRVDAFIGPIPVKEEGVKNPNRSRNKGCGTRLKSSWEILVQAKGQRTCNICNKTKGHNARTCPTLKK